jgi:hypothetical protein
MLLPTAAAALIPIGVTLLILAALHLTAESEFAPLSSSDAAMLRYAEAGYFPLVAAAETERRAALATAAQIQTFGGLFIIFIAGAYGAWRGFSNPRARGWSNAFWMGSIVVICLGLSALHGLSAQKLDYLVGGGPGGAMLPLVILLKRGFFAGGLAAFFCLLCHDTAYRLHESFVDFGLIEANEATGRREKPKSFKGKGAPRGFAGHSEAPKEEGGFGQRDAPHEWSAPASEEARARTVLGVGASATKGEIERAFRSQIKRAHPDHGGSVARAAALNAARDLLLGR